MSNDSTSSSQSSTVLSEATGLFQNRDPFRAGLLIAAAVADSNTRNAALSLVLGKSDCTRLFAETIMPEHRLSAHDRSSLLVLVSDTFFTKFYQTEPEQRQSLLENEPLVAMARRGLDLQANGYDPRLAGTANARLEILGHLTTTRIAAGERARVRYFSGLENVDPHHTVSARGPVSSPPISEHVVGMER